MEAYNTRKQIARKRGSRERKEGFLEREKRDF